MKEKSLNNFRMIKSKNQNKVRVVVLENIVKNWKGHKLWSDKYITKEVGDIETKVLKSQTNKFQLNDAESTSMTIRQFIKNYKSSSRDTNYLLVENLDVFKGLKKDIDERYLKFLPKWRFKNKKLWMGFGSSTLQLHNELHEKIICEIKGKKSFEIYDPFQSDNLYSQAEKPNGEYYTPVDSKNPDFLKFPKSKKLISTKVLLNEGECLVRLFNNYSIFHHIFIIHLPQANQIHIRLNIISK
jgi:hypothetical protein